MNITPASIDAIFYNFSTAFQQAFLAQLTFWEKFAQQVPSAGRENRYFFIDRLPRMREWLGERFVANLAARGYTLVNRDWELTDELDRNTVQDDQYGQFAQMNIPMMGMQSKLWPDQLLVDVLQNGHAAGSIYSAYDGQPFFNASHPVNPDAPGGTTYSNYSSTGMALNAANFNTVRATMMAYQGADGRPLGVMPNLLIVPPLLEVTARQILQATFIAPATAVGMNAANAVQSNVLTGMADILVHPYLAGQDTTWYLVDTSKVIRPFIFQLRQAPQFVFRNKPDDVNLFLRKKFIFGVDSRGAAGFSLPFLAYKAVA